MKFFPARVLISAVALAWLLVACGSNDAPNCVAAHCSSGETACLGEAFATCSAIGTWEVGGCGSAQWCDPATKSCVAKSCHNPGAGVCTANDKVNVCASNGSYMDEQTCTAGTSCFGGVCVAEACQSGAKACGFGKRGAVIMVCDGAWSVETECGGAQYCSGGATPSCVDLVCTPGERSCDGNVAVVCSGGGQSESRTSCASHESCDGGACLAKICGAAEPSQDIGAPEEDTAIEEDTGPEEEDIIIPPPETIAQVQFDVGEITHSYDLNAQAMYVTGESLLLILGQKGVRQIELRLSPIDPDDVGNFTDTDDSEIGVLVCYNDGAGASEPFGGCQVGFTHASIEYDVTIDANNGKGSWISGTFSTTLINSVNEQIRLKNGMFNVLFK